MPLWNTEAERKKLEETLTNAIVKALEKVKRGGKTEVVMCPKVFEQLAKGGKEKQLSLFETENE